MSQPFCIIEPIDKVAPSSYNPRHRDAERMRLIMLSLRKLGFLLPVYSGKVGEIVSGHQRQHAAGQLGATKLPVFYMDLDKVKNRKSVNLLFNRATNDLAKNDTTAGVTNKLRSIDLDAMAAELADKVNDSAEFFPCVGAQRRPIADYVAANHGRWSDHMATNNKQLMRFGCEMPIVVDPAGVVVNGIGRLQAYSEMEKPEAWFVDVTAGEAVFASAMLNYLTMDFDVEGKFGDEVRFNNFRRKRQTHQRLGTGYSYLTGVKDLSDAKARAEWIGHHGRSVLDFGAGLRVEGEMLRKNGIRVDEFEPFVNDGHDRVDPEASRAVARQFLAAVASGHQWDSIFLNFVLNSVPFDSDRRHILVLLAALDGPKRKTWVSTKSVIHPDALPAILGEDAKSGASSKFYLGYEDNLLMSELTKDFRTQKYFTDREFMGLLQERWHEVKLLDNSDTLRALCRGAKPVDDDVLQAAIEFEFDLPYPDGSRMGLVAEAKQAFATRLE